MQSRVFIRSPQVCRVVKAPAAARAMSLFSAPPFLQRGFPTGPFASLEREIAPFFRIMEDLNRSFDSFTPAPTNRGPAQAPFQPRFDVREIDNAYELRGELPGVESSNIEVEFSDAQTLVIRGRTASESTNGTGSQQQQQTPAAVEASESTTTNAVADDTASTHSTSSYQKASVEDDAAAENATSTSTPGQATPAESAVNDLQPTEQPQSQLQSTATDADTARYWISERRTGSFERVFTFPNKIDQEAVKASLKDGVLSVVVPKATLKAPRRITVQ